MSDFAKFVDDISGTAVSPELLGEVMKMYAGLTPEECGFETRARRVMEHLGKKNYGEKHGLLAMAIMRNSGDTAVPLISSTNLAKSDIRRPLY